MAAAKDSRQEQAARPRSKQKSEDAMDEESGKKNKARVEQITPSVGDDAPAGNHESNVPDGDAVPAQVEMPDRRKEADTSEKVKGKAKKKKDKSKKRDKSKKEKKKKKKDRRKKEKARGKKKAGKKDKKKSKRK